MDLAAESRKAFRDGPPDPAAGRDHKRATMAGVDYGRRDAEIQKGVTRIRTDWAVGAGREVKLNVNSSYTVGK